jgi:hypothetical protein
MEMYSYLECSLPNTFQLMACVSTLKVIAVPANQKDQGEKVREGGLVPPRVPIGRNASCSLVKKTITWDFAP